MAKEYIYKAVFFMKVCGQWNDFRDYPSYIKYLSYFRHFYVDTVSFLSIVSLYYTGWRESLGMISFFSIIASLTNMEGISLFLHHKHGQEAIDCLLELIDNHKSEWEDQVYQEKMVPVKKAIRYFIYWGISFIVTYLTLPVFIDLIIIYFNPDSDGYVLPLPFEGFMKLVVKRGFYYYVCIFLGASWTTTSIIMNIGNHSSLYLLCTSLSSEIEIFCTKIKKFSEEVGFNNNIDITQNPVYNEKFQQIVINHQKLLRTAKALQLYYGLAFCFQNIIISICNCSLLFTIMDRFEEGITFVVQNGAMLCLMVSLATASCFMGQTIQDQSQELLETLYDLPWYEQKPVFRKNINMMLMRAKMPMKIHYRGSSALDMHTLMNILNTSYSYFMVLKSTL